VVCQIVYETKILFYIATYIHRYIHTLHTYICFVLFRTAMKTKTDLNDHSCSP